MKLILLLFFGITFTDPLDGLTLITNMGGGGNGGNQSRES